MAATPADSASPPPPYFDARQAYEHVRALCYPRRVGTLGERRAARYVTRQFAALGLAWRRERFPVSYFPAEIGARLAYAAAALALVVGATVVSERPLLAALAWLLGGLAVNLPWRPRRGWVAAWPPRTSSRNVSAWLPASTAGAPARVVFLAHYDTKSQVLPTGIRVVLVTLTTCVCGVLAVAGMAAVRFPGLSPALGPWPVYVGLASLGGLVLNVTGNRSPGALDNASAVGTLLELARSWRPQPGSPLEVIWVATGAEEVGLDGARHFLRTRASWLREKPTLIINLETVGAGRIAYLAGEPHALGLARDVGRALSIRHTTLRVLGAGMDHEPFAAEGVSAVSIMGDVVGKSFALHSRRDALRLVELPALERSGRLAAHLAWQWARMHQPVVDTIPVPLPKVMPVTDPLAAGLG